MKKLLVSGLVVTFAGASGAMAQGPVIDHRPVACAASGKLPRIETRISPSETVAAARIVFQGQTADWYSVAMKPERDFFVGVLPQPKKELKSFHYYVEVTDRTMASSRTAEFTTAVVDSAGACKGKLTAGAVSSASVILQGPSGVAALPAGFASTGVVAGSAAGSGVATGAAGATSGGGAAGTGVAAGAGGGLSTGALVGIAAGVAAAGAGVAVAAKGDEGDSESAETSYSGPVSGQYSVTQVAVGNATTTCSFLRSLSGTMKVTLGIGGGAGEANLDMTETLISVSGGCQGSGPVCCGPVAFMCSLSGTPASLGCNVQRSTTATGNTNTQSFAFTGSLSGSVISGTLTYGNAGGGSTNGSNVTHSGSTTMPVTLR